MRKAYKVLAYLLAAQVVVQAMAIAFALAGLSYYVLEDGGVINKQGIESRELEFTGVLGFPIHGMNGMMIIPLLALLLLVVSFFTRLPGATRRALVLVGLVALQVFLGLFTHQTPYAGPLHALNAFGILVMAYLAGRRAVPASEPAAAEPAAGTPVNA